MISKHSVVIAEPVMRPSPAAWRTWTQLHTWLRVPDGVTAWATESSTTACCATGSTMPSRINTRVGIPKIWSRRSRSVVSSKTNGRCVCTSASPQRRPRENSPAKSWKLRFLGEKGPSTFKADEHNRPDATIEALAKLKPAFRDRHDHRWQRPWAEHGRGGDGVGERSLGKRAWRIAPRPARTFALCGGRSNRAAKTTEANAGQTPSDKV